MYVDLGGVISRGAVVAAGLRVRRCCLGGDEGPLGLSRGGGRESPEAAVFVESGHGGPAAAGEDVEGVLESGHGGADSGSWGLGRGRG